MNDNNIWSTKNGFVFMRKYYGNDNIIVEVHPNGFRQEWDLINQNIYQFIVGHLMVNDDRLINGVLPEQYRPISYRYK